MAIAKVVPIAIPAKTGDTPARAYPNIISSDVPVEIQQHLNQAFDSIYQIGGPAMPQLEVIWFVDSTSGSDNLAVGTDLTNHVEVRIPTGYMFVAFAVSIVVSTGPTGQNLIYDILRSIDNTTWVSIFPAGNGAKLNVVDGTFRGQTSLFANQRNTFIFNDGDILRLDCLQVGSGTPGQKASIQIIGRYQVAA